MNKERKSLFTNIFYNSIYQLLLIIMPLITIPIVSRGLGTNGIGEYAYVTAIASVFASFGMLGINNYGSRTVASFKDDIEKRSKAFFEIWIVQLAFAMLSLLAYFIYYFFICKEQYVTMTLIVSCLVINSLFDINWLFFGMEEFKSPAIKNIIIKIISIVLIVVLVKTYDDIYTYCLIMSLSTLLSSVVMLPYIKKFVIKTKIDSHNLIKHIKPILILFIPIIAVTIYKKMDKIMLETLADIDEVGIYENAEKLINIPVSIITAIGAVMMPRMVGVYKDKPSSGDGYMSKSIVLVSFLAIGMLFGLIGIAKDFCPLFFGEKFNGTIPLIMWLSPTVYFIAFANIIRTQYLIPKKKDKIFTLSVLIGAVINVIFNLIFISLYGAVGACIGTIAAELFVMVYQIIAVRKEIPVGKYLLKSLYYFIPGAIMLVLILLFASYVDINIYAKIAIEVIGGALLYLLVSYPIVKRSLKS
ncbi:MAG: oligosaccharide flippase family protein [Erysipelotrichales bacterium]|nr:oligosaccharide flippase family protein [Erysipelotrichales bacterium]